MGEEMQIAGGGARMKAQRADGEAAKALREALPSTATANAWGAETEAGEIACRPPESAFCIFFGPTPARADDAPRAAGAANPPERVDGAPQDFLGIRPEEEIRLEKTS